MYRSTTRHFEIYTVSCHFEVSNSYELLTRDTNSNIKIPLTDDTLLNARYVLLKSILGNPLVPNVIMKQAMLDYRHLPHLKGIEILNSDVSERIYQHQIIDILCSMGEDISAIYDLQELDSPSLSLRDLGVSSVIRDSLTSATNEIERQKVFARLAECIKTDTHCLKLFCHQLLVVDKPKPDLLDKEIVHFLLELQDEHKEFEKSLWGLKPELLNSISEKHAPFFKTYLKYIVHLYVLKQTDQDLERRIRFLLKSQKLGGPTRQYLVFKNVNAFL